MPIVPFVRDYRQQSECKKKLSMLPTGYYFWFDLLIMISITLMFFFFIVTDYNYKLHTIPNNLCPRMWTL
jgi:hypothetical protein